MSGKEVIKSRIDTLSYNWKLTEDLIAELKKIADDARNGSMSIDEEYFARKAKEILSKLQLYKKVERI